jgi:hypothetical protein
VARATSHMPRPTLTTLFGGKNVEKAEFLYVLFLLYMEYNMAKTKCHSSLYFKKTS